jgi:hypothetical protein
MLFQPAIIALLLAAGLGLVALLAAAPFAWQIVRRWNLASGSENQLAMERRTYLFSSLVALVLGVQLAALLLFVFNADRMSEMFVGAMCAVGTLQVDPWGFPALVAQIAVFFAASQWLLINHLDNQARDYPLVRLKYALLIALVPLLALSLGLQFAYFKGLRADVITSCCGSLFASDARSITGEMAGADPRLAMAWFYGSLAAAIVGLASYALRAAPGRLNGALAGIASGLVFPAAITGIVSFLSLYIYEHPHHHCPFCILKPEYGYRGYALYLPLFLGCAAGIGVGVLQLFRRRPSLAALAPPLAQRLAWVALLALVVFLGLALGMVEQSNLILLEH